MAMDVSSLELTLSQYNAQLTQIQNLISTADALTKLELYDLEKDLMEMIKLTEGQLLSAKKEKLLAKVSGGCSNEDSFDDQSLTSKPIEDNVDKEQSLNISDSAAVNNASIDSFCDMQLDLVGVKCRVKFTQDWGSFQYHNAMILSCDIDDALQDEQIKVCVLFLNPIHISMVPCKYFLDGTCNYEDDCRYSHGYHVDLDEVKEYKEPDFSQVRNGSKCIAKFEENGVWYPAVVDELFEDQVTISFDTYNETLTVNYDSILPMQSFDDNDSSSSEEDETIDVDEQIDISYKPVSMSGHFGEWEEYTKGIGSKLMAKMGYIFGKGLGKDGEGRLDPVEIKLLPPGKSLDYIAEMREKGLIKDPIKKKKKSKQSLSEQKQIPESAFQIINRLTHRESSAVADREHSGQSFTIEDSYKSLKMHMKNRKNTNSKTGSKQKDSKLNIEMFKVSEKITSLKKKLALQNESLARNTGDTKLAVIIKQNIDATEKELSELQRVDRSLQEKLHMKNQSKKLSVF